MRRLLLLTLPCLLVAACSKDDGKLHCEKGSCMPHGVCVEGPDGAYCECDAWYEPLGLTCTTGCCVEIGETCIDDGNCLTGRCLKYTGDTEGYCTTTDCVDNDDCINHASGDTREMCCVEVDTDYHMCLKIAEGYECGDGTGTCGKSCTGTLESACAPGSACIGTDDTDPSATCATPCETNADCADCQWSDDPDLEFQCVTLSGGEGHCLPNNRAYCASNADCAGEETCAYQGRSFSTSAVGLCGRYGPEAPGAACEEHADCSSLICVENTCRTACMEDAHCVEGQACVWLDRRAPSPYCVDSPRCITDEDCVDGLICRQHPQWDADGDRLCVLDPRCARPADCISGESCWPSWYNGSMEGQCQPNRHPYPVGAACDEDDDLCQVYCLDGVCTEWCTEDADCPAGMRCYQRYICGVPPCRNPREVDLAKVCVLTTGD